MKDRVPVYYLLIFIFSAISVGILYYFTELKILEISRLRSDLNQQQSNIIKLSEISDEVPAMSVDFERLIKSLPQNENDVSDFASVVERDARSLGLTILFQFDDFPEIKDVSGQKIYGLPTEISLEGGYQNLVLLVTRLSTIPYYFKIDKITVIKHETKPGVKATLTGVLMMNIEKQATVASPSAIKR